MDGSDHRELKRIGVETSKCQQLIVLHLPHTGSLISRHWFLKGSTEERQEEAFSKINTDQCNGFRDCLMEMKRNIEISETVAGGSFLIF